MSSTQISEFTNKQRKHWNKNIDRELIKCSSLLCPLGAECDGIAATRRGSPIGSHAGVDDWLIAAARLCGESAVRAGSAEPRESHSRRTRNRLPSGHLARINRHQLRAEFQNEHWPKHWQLRSKCSTERRHVSPSRCRDGAEWVTSLAGLGRAVRPDKAKKRNWPGESN